MPPGTQPLALLLSPGRGRSRRQQAGPGPGPTEVGPPVVVNPEPAARTAFSPALQVLPASREGHIEPNPLLTPGCFRAKTIGKTEVYSLGPNIVKEMCKVRRLPPLLASNGKGENNKI